MEHFLINVSAKNSLLKKQNFLHKQHILQQHNLQMLQKKQNIIPNNITTKDNIMTHHHFIKSFANGNNNPSIITPTVLPTSFTGPQLIQLYNIPTALPSSPTTRLVKIAIIIAYHCPTLQSDLNTYWKSPLNFGPLSIPPTIKVYNLGNNYNTDSGWNAEACLDVQMISVANPNAEISIVEAKSANSSDMNAAIKYATTTLNADILSFSWGGPDTKSLISNNNSFINPYIPNSTTIVDSSQNKCFCASSGDNNIVNWPAILSNVVAVGGTTLLWSPDSSNSVGRSEYTWPVAGCGYSTSVSKPLYQSDVSINSSFRAIPDISLVANPETGVFIVYNGLWSTIGGTSASCPLFAGILSLANQKRFNMGKVPLTTVYTQTPLSNAKPNSISSQNIQTHLYKKIYSTPELRSSCLTDVRIGVDGYYAAGAGYDIATGVGTPNATNLCNQLAEM